MKAAFTVNILELQLFNPKNSSPGLQIHIQLKGTVQRDLKGVKSVVN
jgi:hypothetical protein